MPRFADPTAFDRDPPNQMMLDRRWWSSRIAPESRRKDLRDIVQLATSLLARRLAGRNVTADVEASVQLQLAMILQGLGQLYEFEPADCFVVQLEGVVPLTQAAPKAGTGNPRVDILLGLGAGQHFATCALELKYLKRDNVRQPLNRYDVYCDLANLEKYRERHVDETYLYVVTNDPAYRNKVPTGAAADFDLSQGVTVSGNTPLTYRGRKATRAPIALQRDYTFEWQELRVWGRAVESLHMLVVHGSRG